MTHNLRTSGPLHQPELLRPAAGYRRNQGARIWKLAGCVWLAVQEPERLKKASAEVARYIITAPAECRLVLFPLRVQALKWFLT